MSVGPRCRILLCSVLHVSDGSVCMCTLVIEAVEAEVDPCTPSPCGSNAICAENNGAGSCTCVEGYFGDPYSGCRPECVLNSDCPWDKSCQNMKCRDPCVGACGINAECSVTHHRPLCSCLHGHTGNPAVSCHVVHEPRKELHISSSLTLPI